MSAAGLNGDLALEVARLGSRVTANENRIEEVSAQVDENRGELLGLVKRTHTLLSQLAQDVNTVRISQKKAEEHASQLRTDMSRLVAIALGDSQEAKAAVEAMAQKPRRPKTRKQRR